MLLAQGPHALFAKGCLVQGHLVRGVGPGGRGETKKAVVVFGAKC